MQRKIVEELNLDWKTMAMFEQQDEEDDFNGVDLGSRDVIRSVSAVIDQTLRGSRFMIIFINGSDDELDLNRFGIPGYLDCVIIWTFSTRFLTMNFHSTHVKMVKKLRYTDVLLYCYISGSELRSSEILALLREEAADIVARYPCMLGMDQPTVVDCCLYGLILYRRFHSTTGFVWSTHAPSFWVCDGIIQGDRAWEISTALHYEISFECDDHSLDGVFKKLKQDPETPLFVAEEGGSDVWWRRVCWVYITKNNKKKTVHKDTQTILAMASSIFIKFEIENFHWELPNDYFKWYNNLAVLVLTHCSFSFVSPPFMHCHTLRFLGLEHCIDDNSIELQGEGSATKWAFLGNLWVISLYYTDWVEILFEEKIEFMANLMELNIEGVRWPWWTCHQLQKRLPCLQRLRIIRPMYKAEATSTDTGDSFVMINTSLETLDLSGCDGMEYVELSNNSLLRSFNFDGYWPTSHQTSTGVPHAEISHHADKNGVAKTSMVSLAGCTRLENLFLRGLPNLEELDLSGCAIKVLDFGSMVLDVPRLKRLFLLGCEHIRAIKWGSYEQQLKLLELICIDTRPRNRGVSGSARPPYLGAQQKSFRLQVHAITTDARLARSLWDPIRDAMGNSTPDPHSPYALYFNISITSSATRSWVVQPEATPNKEMMMPGSIAGGLLYGDIFTKVDDGPAPMQAFLQAPTGQLNRHIEIGEGSHRVLSETEAVAYNTYNLAKLMGHYTESLHVHDVSSCISALPATSLYSLKWCRVERCPNLQAVFLSGTEEFWGLLKTIWASDLRMARSVWSKSYLGYSRERFKSLQHLHLHRCPSLQFALAMGLRPSFPSLETLHIIHCSDLRHVFVPGDEQHQHTSVQFPKLTNIHLHDLPSLQQVCATAEMLTPAVETIKIRGCPNLRRLPALKGREPGVRMPAVEVEKDVWDALKWDGVDAGHHPSLYQAPVHSRYYKRRMLRRTVLR
ncbi:unnamed protein product [Urochloa decumbens]|uniref:Disease resistance protein At4g27190-like leucine-rich repeats domain-containing protein n=1 Tax=Urochloa decumbens TaxID=240449 RepID=A0ABC9F459_9POAL